MVTQWIARKRKNECCPYSSSVFPRYTHGVNSIMKKGKKLTRESIHFWWDVWNFFFIYLKKTTTIKIWRSSWWLRWESKHVCHISEWMNEWEVLLLSSLYSVIIKKKESTSKKNNNKQHSMRAKKRKIKFRQLSTYFVSIEWRKMNLLWFSLSLSLSLSLEKIRVVGNITIMMMKLMLNTLLP